MFSGNVHLQKEDLKPVVVILYEKIQVLVQPAGPQREGKQGLSVQANVENLGKPLVYKVQALELELRKN